MSSKDLFERVTTHKGGGAAAARGGAAKEPEGDATTKRVSKTVVRRRPAQEVGPPPAPEPPRRRAVEVASPEAKPSPRPAEPERRPAAGLRDSGKVAAPAEVVAPAAKVAAPTPAPPSVARDTAPEAEVAAVAPSPVRESAPQAAAPEPKAAEVEHQQAAPAAPVPAPEPPPVVDPAPADAVSPAMEAQPAPADAVAPPPQRAVPPPDAPRARPNVDDPRRASESRQAQPQRGADSRGPAAKEGRPPSDVRPPPRGGQPDARGAREGDGRGARPDERGPRPEPPRDRPSRPVEVRPQADGPRATQDTGRPDAPRFAGLGAAVVRPPPGYDPTNPATWRRQPQAPPPPPNRGPGPQGGQPGGPSQQTSDAGRSRRRVAADEPAAYPPAPSFDGGDAGGDRRRARGQRVSAPAPDLMLRKRPRRGGKKPIGGSTIAMKAEKRKVRVDGTISVGQLAHEMGLKATAVIRVLMEMGTMVTVNQMLDLDTAGLVAAEFEYEVENVGFQEEKLLQHFAEDVEEGGEPRCPVVTIMGHVDHGKTTLLDSIRSAKVAAGEAGGITQHIGAYQVDWKGRPITFLDTPGHAAFTAMRARGAQVTDVVVLVVAADDGVQPQTVEAINHAKAAGVPIVVAVNKIDKAGVTAEPIMQALTQYELVAEQWGGDTQFVPVSALKKQGIDDLLEAILVQSDVLELSANPNRPAEGIVIEAKVERGKGPVATVLVQKGTLKMGDNIVVGSAFGRVRAMLDDRGRRLKEAGPSMPVEVFGISEVPSVGDVFTVVKSEKDARTVAEHRSQQKREAQFGSHARRTVDDLFAAASAEKKELLHVVLKGDVQGSVEAIKGALEKISVGGTELRILHHAVGNVTESDVNLVMANGGLLLGFNVKIDANARKVAEDNGVKPELFTVIYDLLDRVEGAMQGMVEPEYEEVAQGTVEVRAVFKISKVGTVAGCYVQEGKIARSHKVRVLRNGVQVWDGPVLGLKRFKDDVREVAAGYECGISLSGFDDVLTGDIFAVYALEQVKSA